MINAASVFVYNIYQCQSNTRTAKALAITYVVYLCSRIFSDFSLAFAMFAGCFTLPKLYTLDPNYYDRLWDRVMGSINRSFAVLGDFFTSRIPALAARAQTKPKDE